MRESNELKQAWECINTTLETYGLPYEKETLQSINKNPIIMKEVGLGKIYVMLNTEMLGNNSFEREKILKALVNALETKYKISEINSWKGFKGFFIKEQTNNSSMRQT